MTTSRCRRAGMLLMVSLLAVTPALAQEQSAPSVDVTLPEVEVTAFAALGSAGSSPVGAAINFPLNSRFGLEVEVGYRRGEGNMNALSSSANLLFSLPRLGRTTPYLAAGAGLSQFGAPIIGPGGVPVATQPLVGLLVNAGGGVKVPVDDSWGMRTDARWYKSFGRHASEHWRVAHGVSFDVGR